MRLYPSRHISVSIAKPYQFVYNFLAEPDNFPQWADGLGQLNFVYGDWTVQTPKGPMTIRFSIKNSFGIADHYIMDPDGKEIYAPLRVIENGDGAEVIFTLFHHEDMSFDDFERDAVLVEKDLQKLKTLLEDMKDQDE